MIKVENLHKSYGTTEALKGLSFHIFPGQVVGLLGPNGAGKSTLIKILTGFFEPSSGQVTIAGHNLLTEADTVRPLLGYLPENAPLYQEMTVQENLLWQGQIRGLDPKTLKSRLHDVVEITDLWPVLTKQVNQLSKGFKQRVGLAQALLCEPKFLVLDEPTNGLDPDQIANILNFIKGQRGQTTVLFSTHILPQIEECCQRALVIMGGELKADVLLENQKDEQSFTMIIAGQHDPEVIKKSLASETALLQIEASVTAPEQISIKALSHVNFDLPAFLFNSAVKNNWSLRQLAPTTNSLQQIFNHLSAGALKS